MGRDHQATRPCAAHSLWRGGDRLRAAARGAGRSHCHDDSARRIRSGYHPPARALRPRPADHPAVHDLARPGRARRFRPFDQRASGCPRPAVGAPAGDDRARSARDNDGRRARRPGRAHRHLLRGRRAEWAVDGGVGGLLAIPDFLWALILLLLFGVLIPWLPISGRIDPQIDINLRSNFYLLESLLTGRFDIASALLHHMILPALALALPFAALVARILKASLAEAEDQDYAQIARARGYSRPAILLHEVFPNALIPTVALGGVQVTLLLGGTVLVERIFSYEGIGNMAIDAVVNREFPLIQGLILTFAVLFIALNLAVDLLVALLDPRLRHG